MQSMNAGSQTMTLNNVTDTPTYGVCVNGSVYGLNQDFGHNTKCRTYSMCLILSVGAFLIQGPLRFVGKDLDNYRKKRDDKNKKRRKEHGLTNNVADIFQEFWLLKWKKRNAPKDFHFSFNKSTIKIK